MKKEPSVLVFQRCYSPPTLESGEQLDLRGYEVCKLQESPCVIIRRGILRKGGEELYPFWLAR